MSKPLHCIVCTVLGGLLMLGNVWAADATFTFANSQITGTSPQYFEFDVMMQASTSGTRLGDTQVYIDYNTAGFGSNAVSNGRVTVSKGTLLQGGSAPAFYYTITNVIDNTSSNLAITNTYKYDDSPEYGNLVPTSPTQLCHVRIEIVDPTESAGLSFDSGLMAGQIYESDNTSKYGVTAVDTDDSSLPVQLSSFTAERHPDGVLITWVTESEIDNMGFNIYRSQSKEGPFTRINGGLIDGAGTRTGTLEYTFLDTRVADRTLYYYQLEDIDVQGNRTRHGPVILGAGDLIPKAFQLRQNFPNPFNPTTTIVFGLPRAETVSLKIFNTRGVQVAHLVEEELEAGTHMIEWDGRNDRGQPVPSGIYFYRLDTETFRQTKKMVLTR